MKAFLYVEYLGTPMSGGKPANASVCINGYDTAAFCAGTGYSAANVCEFSESHMCHVKFATRSLIWRIFAPVVDHPCQGSPRP